MSKHRNPYAYTKSFASASAKLLLVPLILLGLSGSTLSQETQAPELDAVINSYTKVGITAESLVLETSPTVSVPASAEYEFAAAVVSSKAPPPPPPPEPEPEPEVVEPAVTTQSESSSEPTSEVPRQSESSNSGSSGSSNTETTSGSVSESSPVPAPRSISAGEAQDIARPLVSNRGWGDNEFSCLVRLWDRESGWNYQAANPTSSARGIAQTMMSVHFGASWESSSDAQDFLSSPQRQIEWGLKYIGDRYGSPCGAWSHFGSVGWY